MEKIRVEEFFYAALMGIDWADQKHAVCLWESHSNRYEEQLVEQKPEGLQEWIGQLSKRFAGKKLAIAVEQSRGALIYFLMRYDFIVLYPINPKALANYRKALRVSGAKDDVSDAQLLLSFLRAHLGQLRAWFPEDEITRKLGMLVEFRRKLVDDSTRITNRMTGLLKQYYPQVLEWVGELKTQLACDFLEKWPTLSAIQKSKPEQLRRFYKRHNCRVAELIEQRIAEIHRASPLTNDLAITIPCAKMVAALAKQLRVLLKEIDEFDEQIGKVFASHPDHQLYESLPGAGPVLESRWAAAMGTNRDKYSSAVEMQQFSGVAPVTERSGKHRWIHRRLACPKFLRQTKVEFAAHSIVKSLWAAAYYKRQTDRGCSRQAALRALAYKWDRIIFRCWKDQTTYDEDRYLQALKRRNSPLAGMLGLN